MNNSVLLITWATLGNIYVDSLVLINDQFSDMFEY